MSGTAAEVELQRAPGPTRRMVGAIAPLALVFVCLVCWQTYEHARAINLAKDALRNRTRDITNSLGVILRSQARFGFITQTRLEAALDEIVTSEEVRGIAVLNQDGEPTAQAGALPALGSDPLAMRGERWDADAVTFVNLVDIGMAWGDDDEGGAPIILPTGPGDQQRGPPPFPGEAPPPFPGPGARRGDGPGGPPFASMRGPFSEEEYQRVQEMMDEEPLTAAEVDELLSIFGKVLFSDAQRDAFREVIEGGPLDERRLMEAGQAAFRAARDAPPRRYGRQLFRRPPWLSHEQYEELRRSRSAHWFVLSLSNRAFKRQASQDLRLRLLVLVAGACALAAVGLAWRANRRSTDLRLRLVRAMDLNAHLRDMNVAAAGLVHETKNPLNVMRGIAQMIAKSAETTEGMRSSAMRIAEEVDRVAGRLNQFIDYSRPLEVKLAPTDLRKLTENVYRILESDYEGKSISLEVLGPDLVVEADEALLRQVLFNLLLNAVQAVGEQGQIEVRLHGDRDVAGLEVWDSGPGVPEEQREEVFRPYVSIRGEGSGLGLAVVRQIVLAHQWDIVCTSCVLGGACFRISGMKPVSPQATP